MRIVHLVNGRDTGGAMTHLLALFKGLSDKLDLTLVALNDGPVAEQAKRMGIDVRVLDGQMPHQFIALWQLFKTLDHPLLLHAHGSRANLIGGLYGRLKRFPVVSTVHSDYALDYDETWLRRLVFMPLSFVALKLTRYQISISKGIQKLLLQRGFPAENTFTVYNGLDFTGYAPTMDKAAFIEKYQIPHTGTERYVGIVTRFHPVKGLEVFIAAAIALCKDIPDVVFLIAGGGEPKYNEQYSQQIMASGFEDRIKLLGFVKPISDFYQVIDINVLTSHSENAPYALLEGGYFGIPAISSRVGGVPELITDGENGLLFADSEVPELVAHLKTLLGDVALRAAYGQALQARIQAEHTHEKMAETHMAIYMQILGRWNS